MEIKRKKRKNAKKNRMKDADLENVCKLVDILNPHRRVSSYQDWFQLGLALYHSHNDGERLLEKWIEISKKVNFKLYFANPFGL